ncbi:hypothetical protein GGH12_006056, partial [Coemansia sp. RSA 1822]
MLLSSYTLPQTFAGQGSLTYDQVIKNCLPWFSNCKYQRDYMAFYKGKVSFNGRTHHCYRCGSYTVYARDQKLVIYRTVYSPALRKYMYDPPIVARIKQDSKGYVLDICHNGT